MPAERFTHRGWSVRRTDRNDNPQTWAIFEKGQRSGSPRGYVWRAAGAEIWLYEGGRLAIADASHDFTTSLDAVVDRIEDHWPQFGGAS